MTFETGLRAGPTWLLRQRKRLMQPRAQPVLRVGIDIDGVIAKTGWNELPWTIANGWEAVDILDAEGLETAVSRVRENRWEGYAITARPTGPGRSVQQQTRRWLERHGASELSVVVDPGNRAGVAGALALDWLVDDGLEQCCCTALETPSRAIWIHPEPTAEGLRQARAAGCEHATALTAAVHLIDTASDP